MKKHQIKQLRNYSALSTSFLLLGTQAGAQIIYHDVDPDATIYLDEFYLDLNDDGSTDFRLVFNVDPGPGYLPDFVKIRINPQGDNRAANTLQTLPVTYSGVPSVTYTSGAAQLYFTVAPILNEGDVVNDGFNFQTEIAELYEKIFYYVYSSYHFETFKAGYWMGEENKFAALQLNIAGANYYGWVRLSLSDTAITIHDFAYEANPDTPIETKIVAYTISWISVNDAGVAGNGSDIAFNFSAVGDEADLLAYRIICAKGPAAEDFSLADAALLTPDQYIDIIPDGSPAYSGNFNPASLDGDGDLITTDQAYKLIVLNVMDPATGFENIINNPSSNVKLVDEVHAADAVDLLDGGNAGNGSDMIVTFDSPLEIQGIVEFRAMIVKRDSADTFTLADAELIPADRYISVPPGEPDYDIYFDALALDTDGDLIEPGKYKAFVLSIADGSTANINALAEPSPSVTIETQTSVVSDIFIEDAGEFGDGRDLKISFPHAALEQTIEEYRVFITNVIDAFDFNIETALTISPAYYKVIAPSGTDILINCTETTTDIYGAPITYGVPYFVFVVSIATQYGINDSISDRSNEVILNFPFVEGIEQANLADANIFSDGDIIHINFSVTDIGNVTCEITDLTGRKVWETELTELENTIQPDLPNGVYQVKLSFENQTFTRQIPILR